MLEPTRTSPYLLVDYEASFRPIYTVKGVQVGTVSSSDWAMGMGTFVFVW